jgi:hypothetical protein
VPVAIAAALIAGFAGCAAIAQLGTEYSGPEHGEAGLDAASPNDPDARGPADAGALEAPSPPPDGAREAGPVGPLGCADSGYDFCDDFEGPLNGWQTLGVSDGTVSTDSTFACSGRQSLHVTEHVDSASSQIYEVLAQRPMTFPDDVFLRTFVRFTAVPKPGIAIVQLVGGNNGIQEEVDTGMFDGQNYGFTPSRSGPAMPVRTSVRATASSSRSISRTATSASG